MSHAATVLPANAMPRLPQRIVCLTEETTEWLYLLGEERRIVGISGFTVRPRRARDEKPKVSAFTSAKIDKILALEPDLVLGFSDMQADIAAALIRAGLPVMVFNQRSVAQIADMLAQLAALGVRRDDAAGQAALANGYQFAVKQLAGGAPLRDYHTVQAPALSKKITHRTRRQEMADPDKLNTLLTSREYYADSFYVVAVQARLDAPHVHVHDPIRREGILFNPVRHVHGRSVKPRQSVQHALIQGF